MKLTARAILSTVMCMQVILLGAQALPHISSFEQNYVFYNPAAVGNQEVLTANFVYKANWTGMKGGARTEILTAHTPLRNPAVALGLSVHHDAIGGWNNTGIFIDYGYRIKMGSNRLSFGLQAGIEGNSLKVTLRDDQYDQAFNDKNLNQYLPNFGTGVYYYSRQYWAGVSMPRIVYYESKTSGKYGMQFNLTQSEYYISGGGRFHAGGKVVIESSVLIRFCPASSASLTILGSAVYSRVLKASLGFRTAEKAMIVLLNYQINRQFSLGYGYDANLGGIINSAGSSGSHEININYRFGYKVNASDPRNF